MSEPFYLRYYAGHTGRFGHEFMEFEFRSDGRCRYANNSRYRHDNIIRKEMYVSPLVLKELQRIIMDCEILKESDREWPGKGELGRQELEIRMGERVVSFETAKIGSLAEVEHCKDKEGFRVFYYLVQDLKCFVLTLISLHFKIKPI